MFMEENQYAVGELPAMWRKHRIQKRQNADGRPRLN